MSLLKVNNITDLGDDPVLTDGVLDVTPPAILQVLQTVKADAFSTTADGDITGLSVSITPSSASSKILVMANIACSRDDAGTVSRSNVVTIFRGATNLSAPTTAVTAPIADGFGVQTDLRSNYAMPVIAINYLDSPATTSPVTYQAYVYTNSASGAFRVNQNKVNTGWRGVSTITAMEVAG